MKESIQEEIFKFEPSMLVVLFILSLSKKARGNNYYFHNGENGYKNNIFYGDGEGKNQFFYMPVKASGFDYADNQFSRPTLTFDNTDGFFSLKTRFFEDFIGYEVIRIRTFAKFLHGSNFPNETNPYGTPTEDSFPEEKYIINQKVQENANVISFELASPLENENAFLPNRRIVYNTCQWHYRGSIGCGYSGIPKTDSKGNPIEITGPGASLEFNSSVVYNKGDYVKITEYDNPLTNPTRYFVCLHNNTVNKDPQTNKEHWVEDACAKNIKGCRARFGSDESTRGLPFGGFPGSWKK